MVIDAEPSSPRARLGAALLGIGLALATVAQADPGSSGAATGPGGSADPDAATTTLVPARAYGHVLGDVIEEQVRLPAGARVDPASLPTVGAVAGGWLSLLSRSTHAWPGGAQTLHLRYQVINAPREVEVIELPALALRLDEASGGGRRLPVAAVVLTVGPLTPADGLSREGLPETQPDAPSPLPDAATRRARMQAWLGLAALAALYWLYRRQGAWWFAGRRRPFARALRRLRRLQRDPATGRAAAATPEQMRVLHDALDQAHGGTLLPADLPAFLATRPAFAPYAAALRAFLEASERAFFAPTAAANPVPSRTLLGLCRDLARHEAAGAPRGRSAR